jgi:hypothetical protein
VDDVVAAARAVVLATSRADVDRDATASTDSVAAWLMEEDVKSFAVAAEVDRAAARTLVLAEAKETEEVEADARTTEDDEIKTVGIAAAVPLLRGAASTPRRHNKGAT